MKIQILKVCGKCKCKCKFKFWDFIVQNLSFQDNYVDTEKYPLPMALWRCRQVGLQTYKIPNKFPCRSPTLLWNQTLCRYAWFSCGTHDSLIMLWLNCCRKRLLSVLDGYVTSLLRLSSSRQLDMQHLTVQHTLLQLKAKYNGLFLWSPWNNTCTKMKCVPICALPVIDAASIVTISVTNEFKIFWG